MNDFESYAAICAVNMSTLKHMATSPLHFHHARTTPRKDTKTFGLGRAIHGAILEPERFFNSAMVCDIKRDSKAWRVFEDLVANRVWEPYVCDSGSRNSKAYSQAIAQHPYVVLASEWTQLEGILHATRQGRELVTQEEMGLAIAVSGRVHSDPVARAMLEGGKAEQTIVWEDEETGVRCKGRIDYLRPDLVVEVKSTERPMPRRFGYQATDLHYFEQLAFYCDGAGVPDAAVVVVESKPPHDVIVYPGVPAPVLEEARRVYRGWLTRVRECEVAGHWPGIAPDGATWDLPDRAFGSRVVDDPGLDWSEE